ncbi:MAG: hypothetical protein WCO65_02140 [bacterium]
MISIQSVVKEIIYKDEEALIALSRGYMNLSGYAKQIQKSVEHQSKKGVHVPSIIMALSRIQKSIGKKHPLVVPVEVDFITTKLPLAEIVYDKSSSLMKELKNVYESVSLDNNEFLSMTLGTREITIICSEYILQKTLKKFKEQPKKIERNLAGLCISFSDMYYEKPNITFSMIRKFAVEKIPLSETISTYTEIVFVFKQEYLSRALNMFSDDLVTKK